MKMTQVAAGGPIPKDSGVHKGFSWLLLAGLLILRLPLVGGVAFFSQPPYPAWLSPVYEIGTYLLTAAFIWWERQSLADLHIDGLAIVMIILFKPIETLIQTYSPGYNRTESALAFPQWPSLIIWATAIGLLVALWPARHKLLRISARSLCWLGVGAGIGIVTALAWGYPTALQIPASRLDNYGLAPVLPAFFFQLGYAAVKEEPLFRGFLWGHLRRLGWKDVWIWLFQAGLFVLGHIYYWNRRPISFWIIVPTGALILGALAWRSRTIVASMAAHGAMNALGEPVGYWIASHWL